MNTPRLTDFRRIVVKVGSSLLVDAKAGRLKESWLVSLTADLAALHHAVDRPRERVDRRDHERVIAGSPDSVAASNPISPHAVWDAVLEPLPLSAGS